nr:PREDICTED: choline transporter-like protein 1 [Tribolium castaneum]|eukprot:XP_015833995.1 PREDICTED: choline transporter-like protein 1 [Tribolium castaneum]
MFATLLVILTIFAIIYTACSSDLNDGVANEYVLEELNDNFGFLAIVCCIGLGLSVIALFCFRYFVNIFIWTMLIVTVLLTCALAGFVWYISAQPVSHNQISFKIAAIILTAFSLITATCILVWNEQIKLLIKFYEEAIKIVFAMPQIFLVSLLTSISVLVIAVLCRYMIVLLDNSGGPLSGFFLNTKTYDGG